MSEDNECPCTPTTKHNIAKKMLAIMSDIKMEKPHAEVKFKGQKQYDYHSYDQIIDLCRKLFIKHNVYPLFSAYNRETTQKEDKYKENIVSHTLFIDIDTGEELSMDMLGGGSAKDEKGVYKAMTGAQREHLKKAFLIYSKDDPERDEHEPAPKPQPIVPQESINQSKIALQKSAYSGSNALRNAFIEMSPEMKNAFNTQDELKAFVQALKRQAEIYDKSDKSMQEQY